MGQAANDAGRRGGWVQRWYLALGLTMAPAATMTAWSHVRAEGLTVLAVTAMIGAGAGVVALVVGWRGVWGDLGTWGRIVALPVLGAVLYGLVVPWCIAVAVTLPPRPRLDPRAATRLGSDVTDVSFPGANGSMLSGWFVPSRNGSVVILLHGSSSTRTGVVREAAVFAAAGYGVLVYDAEGHGRSEGTAMELGWNADADVSAAIDDLIARHAVEPGRVALYGSSLGGEVAIGVAARDDRVAAVVAEGATGRSLADHRWLPDEYGWRGWAQYAVDHVTYGLVDALVRDGPPEPLRDDVAASPTPILLVTAGNVVDEARAARWIRAGSPRTVSIWTVPGARHTAGLETEQAEWTTRVVGFLDSALADR